MNTSPNVVFLPAPFSSPKNKFPGKVVENSETIWITWKKSLKSTTWKISERFHRPQNPILKSHLSSGREKAFAQVFARSGQWWYRMHHVFWQNIFQLGGGFKDFYLHPYLRKWSNLTHIFLNGLQPPTSKPFCVDMSWRVVEKVCKIDKNDVCLPCEFLWRFCCPVNRLQKSNY